MDLAVVFKALAPIAARGAAVAAPNLFRSWTVAFETKRKSKKAGLRVKYFSLRSTIDKNEIFATFHTRSEHHLAALGPVLRRCIRDAGPGAEAELLALLAAAYVHSLPPSQAVRLESEITREHVSTEVSSIREGIGDDRSFEANCELLSPFRAEAARLLRPHWPALPCAIASIVTAEDRPQLFHDWVDEKPDWMIDAPASALCWLAAAAQDFGAPSAAQALLGEAIAAGASPRHYWIAKAALASPLSKEQAEEKLLPALAHPLAAALWSDLQAEHSLALEQIGTWQPTSTEDLATKQLIVAQLLAVNDIDRAIDIAVEGYEKHGDEGCALFAAKLLVGRGSTRNHPRFMNDLTKGLELAKAARTSRRSWGGESSPAVLTMITAYKLLGSPEQAWRTGTASPEGTATVLESTDFRVRSELARTAADLGMTERARELLPDLNDGPDKAQVKARIVEAESGFESSVNLWTQALATTRDPTDALNIAFRLAHRGKIIEWPAWIIENYAAELADIDLISALFRNVEGSIPKARTRAASSPQVFHGLMTFHISREEYPAAALVAEDSGRRWNDPETWLRAAEIHVKAGDQDRAVEAAEQAIRVGGLGWLREGEARRILIEIRSVRGQWDQALIEAGRFLEIEPNNDSAKWAFVYCQFMTGDYQGAWDSYASLGSPSPRTPDDARIWLQLHSRFAPIFEHLHEASHIAARWPEDESLRAVILISLMSSTAEPATDEHVAQIRELKTGFFADFPDSAHFRVIHGDENDPVESLREMLEPLADREEALQPVSSGDMPLGFATDLTGKSYAEVCLTRGSGKLFAGDPATLESEVAAVLASFDNKAVLDTSALSTLALLGDTAREWLGLFASAMIPTQAIHDAQRAVASLAPKSTATIGMDRPSGRPRIHKISEQEAKLRLERANTLLAISKKLVSIPHPEILQLPEVQSTGREFQWMLALDLAKTRGLPFWCDDRVLRSLAAGVGVQSFGTFALLEAFRRSGSVDLNVVQACEAQLVHHYYVGGRFDPVVMELAAQMDSWSPRGIAASISETGPTPSPEKQINLVLKALRHCAGDPEAVQGWVASVAQWLDSVSPDAATATGNLQLWFSTLLEEPWINSSSLPYVLAGLRSAGSDKTDMGSVVPEVIGNFYAQIADQTNHAVAAEYVRELVSLAPAGDRSGVLRRIIAP